MPAAPAAIRPIAMHGTAGATPRSGARRAGQIVCTGLIVPSCVLTRLRGTFDLVPWVKPPRAGREEARRVDMARGFEHNEAAPEWPGGARSAQSVSFRPIGETLSWSGP
jgi:hypothetical protein